MPTPRAPTREEVLKARKAKDASTAAYKASRKQSAGPSFLERVFNFKTSATRYKESKAARPSANLSVTPPSGRRKSTATFEDVPATPKKTPVAMSSFAEVPRSRSKSTPQSAGKSIKSAKPMQNSALSAAKMLGGKGGLSENNAVMQALRKRAIKNATKRK